MILRKLELIVALAFASIVLPAKAVTIETVPIGHPGNAADPTVDMQGGCCFGSVASKYRMGTFEVTNDQYAEFLNSVAASDPYELYDPSMATTLRSGIVQHGLSGSFTYSVKENFGNKPVTWVSFWDAARFANWLHHGQPTGPQDESTTEDGAYFLGGVTFPDNDSVTRKPEAKWYLPSEDEWFKAAYFDPRNELDGGPPDDDHYWQYATKTDNIPVAAVVNTVGDIVNPGPTVVNYKLSAIWNGATGNVTTVGSAGPSSASYYGTYDQAGNVWELNDTIIKRSGDRNFRGNRGGNWDDQFWWLLGSKWQGVAGIEDCGTRWQCFGGSVGFRVARQFSPLDLNGDDVVDAGDIDLLTEQVRIGSLNTAYDLNADGAVDAQDRSVWVEDLRITYFGDANLDGEFDSSDLVDVLAAGEYEDAIVANSSWSTGDWDGDAEFNSNDLLHALQAGGYEQGPRVVTASVPEPSTGCVLRLAMLLLVVVVRPRKCHGLKSFCLF